MRQILPVIFLLSFFSATAQDLTGIWRGHFKTENHSRFRDSLGFSDKYKFETQLNQNGKAFDGVTYSYNTTVFYGKASCAGAISNKTKKVLLTENQLLEVKSWSGGACLMTCFLQYSKVGDEEFLEGTYTSISVTDSSQCGGGTVFLRKVPTSDFYKEPFLVEKEKEKVNPKPPVASAPKNTLPDKKANASAPKTNNPGDSKKKTPPPVVKRTTPSTNKSAPSKTNTSPKKQEPAAASPKKKELKQLPAESVEKGLPQVSAPVPVPRVLATRKNELVQTIISHAREVSIKIYDNGTIDNDTVSVYINNKLVISKQRLTEKPLLLKINLDEKVEFHELIMVAENLGEIPPNTSLMIVNAGTEQHEVRITSTEQKNAVVRFKKAEEDK